MKNFLSFLFVSFCLVVSAEAESIWQVSPDSYRLNTNNGSIRNYSSLSNALTVDIEQLSTNEYSISDFFGGYYAQGLNYGSNYAMHGTFTIDTFGNITTYSSFVDGWGYSANSIRGSFNTTTQTLSLVVNYGDAGYLEFHVMVSKVELLTRSINVAETGTLSSLISADDQNLIENLTLTGNLNGTDLAFIGNMPFLSSLDLAGAHIVAGGTPESKQDTLGQLNNARLKELYLPASLSALGTDGYGYHEGNDIFFNLPLLERINASAQSTVFSSIDGILYNKAKTKLIAAPRGISSWVIIPEGVTEIAYHAFGYCTEMPDINLPKSLTTIGHQAFDECHALTSVNIPANVTKLGVQQDVWGGGGANDETLSNPFTFCHGLRSITVSKDNSAFSASDNVLFCKDGKTLVAYPEAKGSSYSIPESVNSIASMAFAGCNNVTNVTIPESVTTLGENTFWCAGLTSVIIPGSIHKISDWAFNTCYNLTNVTISEGVDTIGARAFASCFALPSITLPGSVEVISSAAFANCNLLKEVYVLRTDPPVFTRDAAYGDSIASFASVSDDILYVPTGYKNTYSSAKGWSSFSTIIDNLYVSPTIYTIDNLTYCINTDLPNSVTLNGYIEAPTGKLTIPSTVSMHGVDYSVNTIGSSAFWNCNGLTSVEIPNTIKSIGSTAFGYCTGLTSIGIPSSVDFIYGRSFLGCKSMKSITVDPGNTHYCDIEGVLYTINRDTLISYPNAKGLSYSIPSSATTIGDDAFGDCDITSVTIPNSVNSMGGYAFGDCTGLTSVTIPSAVTSIQEGTFYNCTSLTSMEIPNAVDSIKSGAFEYCNSMKSITIPSSVTLIAPWAFGFCNSMKSITVDPQNTHYCDIEGVLYTINKDTLISYPNAKGSSYSIPNSVTTIGMGAFAGCSDITSVTIPNSVSSIIDWAFEYCRSIKSITLPSSVTSIYGDIFYNCDSLTSIISESNTPPNVGWQFYGIVPSAVTLYVPIGSKDAYSSAIGWKDFTNIVEMDMEAVKSQTYGKIPVTKTYYSVSGRETGSAQKGINIVKETYRDGSSRSYKVIVK